MFGGGPGEGFPSSPQLPGPIQSNESDRVGESPSTMLVTELAQNMWTAVLLLLFFVNK